MIGAARSDASDRRDSGSAMVGDARFSGDDLDAHLERLRQAGGWPADFEDALKSLAESQDLPLRWTAALRIARVGITGYGGLPNLPGELPPVFEGRSQDELCTVARATGADLPRQHRRPDESLLEYGEYLGEALVDAVLREGVPRTVDLERAIAAYVQVLSLDLFRDMVGWERSLDCHALCVLTAERTLRHLGVRELGAAEEVACFRWLHLATYAEVLPEHLREQAARRAIRLAHQRQPAGAVAVMTCETPLGEALRYQQLVGSAATAAYTPEQLRGVLDRLATEGKERRRWAIRKEAFAEIGHLDLTEAADSEGPDYDAYVHGHLLRWMVEEDLPVRPVQLGWSRRYASYLCEFLVHLPVRKGRTSTPVLAHLRAMHLLRRHEGSIPLSDELVLLAWLMDQRGFGIRLGPFLTERDRWLTRLAGETNR
jgi:hypothetical protein